MEIAKMEGVVWKMAMEKDKMEGLEKEKEKKENVAKANGTKVAKRTKKC